MINKIVDDILLAKLGNKTLFIIRRRTKQGMFLPGSSDNAGNYSEKPFAMPLTALNQTNQGTIRRAAGTDSNRSKVYDPENFQIFTAKSKALWVLVKGGYSKLRSLLGKQNDKVTMTWSGSYLRDLGVIRTGSNSATLGWKSSENQKLAYWHNIAGAGKSKRIHKILGLTKQEEKELIPIVEKELIKNLDNYFKYYIRNNINE